MSTHRIGVIPGDGTGPEVVREGRKVLDAVAAAEGFAVDCVEYDLGAARWLRTGETLPDAVLEEFRGLDALYLVNPRHFPHAEADARATGALDVLRQAQVCANLAGSILRQDCPPPVCADRPEAWHARRRSPLRRLRGPREPLI